MEPLGIGEFARRSCLSPKALRLYEEMGLLWPARRGVQPSELGVRITYLATPPITDSVPDCDFALPLR